MPINRDKTQGNDTDDTLFVLREGKRYTHEQVCDLLERAERMGFDLESNELNGLTVDELFARVERLF